MFDLSMLDRAYFTVMQSFIHTGRAPHYSELAAALGLSVEDGRQLLRELMNSGIPAWQHPGTDDVVSFAPFHNLPTQYRISIDGEQKWHAQ
jgi:hypothetical protein